MSINELEFESQTMDLYVESKSVTWKSQEFRGIAVSSMVSIVKLSTKRKFDATEFVEAPVLAPFSKNKKGNIDGEEGIYSTFLGDFRCESTLLGLAATKGQADRQQ